MKHIHSQPNYNPSFISNKEAIYLIDYACFIVRAHVMLRSMSYVFSRLSQVHMLVITQALISSLV